MNYLRKKRAQRDYLIKRFMMFPQRVILGAQPEWDERTMAQAALVNSVWSVPEELPSYRFYPPGIAPRR